MAPDSSVDRSGTRDTDAKYAVLGLAYLLVGIGFFDGLLTDSIRLLTAVLAGVLGLILLSLVIITRQEGLVTAENKLIGTFVLVAMGLLFGLYEYTQFPSEIVFGLVFLVGVIVPHLLLEYTDYGTAR